MSSVKLISTLFSLLICAIIFGCAICFVIRYLNRKKRLSNAKNRTTRQNQSQGPVIRHINFPTPNNNQSDVIILNETDNNPSAASAPVQTNTTNVVDSNLPPSYEEICGSK